MKTLFSITRIFLISSILAITGTVVPVNTAWSSQDHLNQILRKRCVRILRDAMKYKKDSHIIFHAAEALLWNQYIEGVEESLTAKEKIDNAIPEKRIYIWRVLAIINKKTPHIYQKYVHKIRDVAVDTQAPDRQIAIESLGKQGYSEHLPEIIHFAEKGTGKIKAFARWVLANSGEEKDETYLTELLKTDDPDLYGMASYALKFFSEIRSETYSLIKQCAERIQKDSEARVYVLSAQFIHAPVEEKENIKRELISYELGKKHERYEVCEALGFSGNRSNILYLERQLTDSHLDVRVAASNAILRLDRKPLKGMAWLDWLVIVAYAVMLLSIGVYYMHRSKTSDDFLLGGRKTNPVMSGISLIATTISAISFLMLPGETIKYGPALVISAIAAFPIAFVIVGYLVIPYIMRLPITSAYELLENPLGRGARLAASLVFLSVRFLWMGLLIYLTSKVMVSMMNWNPVFIPVIAVILGIITLIYCTMGGFKAVILTDVTQFSLLLLGAVVTIIFVTVKMGGVTEWIPTTWAPNWDKLIFFSINPQIRITVIGIMLGVITWWICISGSDQMAIQRFIATRDAKAARRAFLSTIIANSVSYVILLLVGFALLKYYLANPHFLPDGKSIMGDTDIIFPHFIVNSLPIGITGLVVAGLLSAAMSSLSSGINSAAAVFASDIVPIFKKEKRDNENIIVAKYASVGVGVMAVLLSTFIGKIPGNLFEITVRTSDLFVGPMFNLFFMALFIPFATPIGTIIGTIYGLTTAILIGYWEMLTGNPGWSIMFILPLALLVSITFSCLFSLIPTKGKKKGERLLWIVILLIPLVVTITILLAGA